MTAWTIAVLGITFLTLWAGSALLPLEGQPLASVARLVYLGLWVGWLLAAVRLGSLCHSSGWKWWWRRHRPRLQYEERTDCATSCMASCQSAAETGADSEEVAAVVRLDPRAAQCAACAGTGHVRDDKGNWVLCGSCLGNGVVRPREGFNPPPAKDIPRPPSLPTPYKSPADPWDEKGPPLLDIRTGKDCEECEADPAYCAANECTCVRACARCNGTGKEVWPEGLHGTYLVRCGTCKGTGKVQIG